MNASTRSPAGPCSGKIHFSTSSVAGEGGAGEGGAGEGGADDDDDDDEDEDDDGAMAVPQMTAAAFQPNSYGGRPVTYLDY